MFTTSQVFVVTSPIIFDGDRRSGSPMAGPKPQKRWLSIPIRIAARITVILAIWKKKQHQTYGNPGPDLGRPYTFQWEKTAYLCKIFLLQLNMPGVWMIQFNVYLPASVHSGVWLGWILDCTYRSRSNCVIGFSLQWLLLSLLVIIAVGLHQILQ